MDADGIEGRKAIRHGRCRGRWGWCLFFGGCAAGVVSDALYHRRPNSGLVDFATAALALAGIVMVAVSVWMAIGSQLRRMR